MRPFPTESELGTRDSRPLATRFKGARFPPPHSSWPIFPDGCLSHSTRESLCLSLSVPFLLRFSFSLPFPHLSHLSLSLSDSFRHFSSSLSLFILPNVLDRPHTFLSLLLRYLDSSASMLLTLLHQHLISPSEANVINKF